MSAASISWLAVVSLVAGLSSGFGAEMLVRRCGSTAPRWRPAVLIALALLVSGAVSWRFADRLSHYPAYLLLAVVAVPLAVLDMVERRVPDAIVKPGFLLAAVLLAAGALHTHQPGSLLRAILAAVFAYAAAIVLIVSTKESMGWGDVLTKPSLGMPDFRSIVARTNATTAP
jgi:leader peptidase (prepilin peptidase)/N-methyltransferase